MKLKGLTKLALSGVALAAVAATLGTSTYAWYVTNAKATVQGVQGASKAIGAGTILVAENLAEPITDTEDDNYDAEAVAAYEKAHGHTNFKADLTLSSTNLIAPEAENVTGLNPVTPRKGTWTAVTNATTADIATYYESLGNGKYKKTTDTAVDAGKTYYTQPTAVNKANDAIDDTIKWYDVDGKEATTNNYIQFDVWVYSKETVNNAVLEYAFENTTLAAAYAPQVAYAADAPVNMGQTFTKNIQDALRMSYVRTEYKNNATTTVTVTPVDNGENGDAYDGNTAYFTVAVTTDESPVANKNYFTKTNVTTYESFSGDAFEEDTDYYVFTRQSFEDEDAYKAFQGTLYTRTSATTDNWGTANTSKDILDVKSCSTKSTAPNADFDFATGGDANAYYENVLGKAPVFSTPLAGTTGVQSFTIHGGYETKFSFYVWLEGTDTDCFDSVSGQSFAFTFTFKA